MDQGERFKLTTASVVQISPDTESVFAGCFLQVTEVKSFGVQGFICMPTGRGEKPGAAYYRARWDEIEYVGDAAWAPQEASADD